jgi:hypothetical protein
LVIIDWLPEPLARVPSAPGNDGEEAGLPRNVRFARSNI